MYCASHTKSLSSENSVPTGFDVYWNSSHIKISESKGIEQLAVRNSKVSFVIAIKAG